MSEDKSNFEPRATQDLDRSAGAWVLLFLVRFYIVFLSPFFGGSCKFYPSCSNYAFEAISSHGAWRGFLLATKRLLRCHPFTKGGFDPVPDLEVAQTDGLVPSGASLASHDIPTLGCLGKPFAAVIRGPQLRVRSKEEPAQ
jgi:uncharacterized protein